MGTCGHQIGEELLLDPTLDPQGFLGRTMGFLGNGASDWIEKLPAGSNVIYTHTVDIELIHAVQTYVGFVRNLVTTLDAELLVEQAVPIGHITGEEGATGSSDAVLLVRKTKQIIVIDLKLGRGKVYAYDVIQQASVDPITEEVTPAARRMNLQGAMYCLGTYHKFGLLDDFERVTFIVVQPFLNSVSEHETSLQELLELGKWIGERAAETRDNPTFVPGNKQCHFCRAKFDCHARNAEMLTQALDGFDDVESFAVAQPKPIFLPQLGQMFGKVEAIRQWCDDIESKVLAELEAGNVVIGPDNAPMKLVEGKKPHKAWSNEQTAMEIMTRAKLRDLMWVKRLISPAQAEKLAPQKPGRKIKAEGKTPIGKFHWKELSALVTQGEGAAKPALGTDPRPALLRSAQGMPEVEDAEPNSDLF